MSQFSHSPSCTDDLPDPEMLSVEQDQQGQLSARKTGQQGSGVLMSMSRANCFILLPEECDGVAAGEAVRVQPFAGFV
jgi:molybdopterin molybdotransferase